MKSKPVNAAIVVANLQKQAKPLLKKVQGFKISDATSANQLIQHSKDLKAVQKQANEKLASIVDPINQGLKEVRALFKPFQELTSTAISQAKVALLEFENKKDAKASQLQQSFKGGSMSVAKFAAKQEEFSTKLKGTRENQVLVIVKPNKIPRKYLIPDESKILADLKLGKTVEGCKLATKKTIAI